MRGAGASTPLAVWAAVASLPCAGALSIAEFSSALFTPDCSARLFDRNTDCVYVLPFYISVIVSVFVGLVCFAHGGRRCCNTRSRTDRNDKAAAKEKKVMDGNQSPGGNVVYRFSAPGGRTVCANCEKKIEYCYGSRDEEWYLCKKCHTDLLMIYEVARIKGVPITLPNSEVEMVNQGADGTGYGGYGTVGGYGAPVVAGVHEIELRLPFETLQAHGTNVHNWFDEKLKQKAGLANIAETQIPVMEKNLMVFHARGRHLKTMEEFDSLSKERGDFPIIFKFPQVPSAPVEGETIMSREVVLNKLLEVTGFDEDEVV